MVLCHIFFLKGDYNMTPDRHLGSAWIDKCRPDLLITESTYATTIRDSKRCRERDFLKKVHTCVENGGKVSQYLHSFLASATYFLPQFLWLLFIQMLLFFFVFRFWYQYLHWVGHKSCAFFWSHIGNEWILTSLSTSLWD